MTKELSQALNINPLKVSFTEVMILGVAQFYTFSWLVTYWKKAHLGGSSIFPSAWAQVSLCSHPSLFGAWPFHRFQAHWLPGNLFSVRFKNVAIFYFIQLFLVIRISTFFPAFCILRLKWKPAISVVIILYFLQRHMTWLNHSFNNLPSNF